MIHKRIRCPYTWWAIAYVFILCIVMLGGGR